MRWFRFDPSESEAVQTRLFELGYVHRSGKAEIWKTEAALGIGTTVAFGLTLDVSSLFYWQTEEPENEISKAEALQLGPNEYYVHNGLAVGSDEYSGALAPKGAESGVYLVYYELGETIWRRKHSGRVQGAGSHNTQSLPKGKSGDVADMREAAMKWVSMHTGADGFPVAEEEASVPKFQMGDVWECRDLTEGPRTVVKITPDAVFVEDRLGHRFARRIDGTHPGGDQGLDLVRLVSRIGETGIATIPDGGFNTTKTVACVCPHLYFKGHEETCGWHKPDPIQDKARGLGMAPQMSLTRAEINAKYAASSDLRAGRGE